MLSKTLVAIALFGSVTAHATTLVHQDFADINALAGEGWILDSRSNPSGPTDGFFQGDSSVFNAQSGNDNAYLAANFNSTVDGGKIKDWLITPEFSTAVETSITFYAKTATARGEPYKDEIAFGLSAGSSKLSDFILGSFVTLTKGADWTEYTVYVPGQGAGSTARFAIEYAGNYAKANYIGIDSLDVTLPEPSTWLMLGIGLLGLFGLRRRSQG